MKILFIFFVGSQVLGQQVFETTSYAPYAPDAPFAPTPTSFTCHGRPPGYYADLETGCKTYHVCDGNSHFTYVCPKRTLFQQRSRICDHSYLVSCEDSARFYEPEIIYPEDEEEILVHLAESEENFLTKGFFENDYNQTEDFIRTEKTQYITDEFTDFSITMRTPTTEMTTQEALAEFTTTNIKQDSAIGRDNNEEPQEDEDEDEENSGKEKTAEGVVEYPGTWTTAEHRHDWFWAIKSVLCVF